MFSAQIMITTLWSWSGSVALAPLGQGPYWTVQWGSDLWQPPWVLQSGACRLQVFFFNVSHNQSQKFWSCKHLWSFSLLHFLFPFNGRNIWALGWLGVIKEVVLGDRMVWTGFLEGEETGKLRAHVFYESPRHGRCRSFFGRAYSLRFLNSAHTFLLQLGPARTTVSSLVCKLLISRCFKGSHSNGCSSAESMLLLELLLIPDGEFKLSVFNGVQAGV